MYLNCCVRAMSSASNYTLAEDCPELLSHLHDIADQFLLRHPNYSRGRVEHELMLALRGAHPDVQAIVGDNRYLMLCSMGYGFASEERALYEQFIYHIPGTPLGMRKAMLSIEEYARDNECTAVVIGTDFGDAERARLLSRFGYKATHQHLTRKL